MKNLRRFLCILMCAVLCIGMAVPTLASSTPTKGSDPLAGLANYNVWRYESSDTLTNVSAGLNPSPVTTGSPEKTVEVKFVADPTYGVKCAATVYEPHRGASYGYHRVMTTFSAANALKVDCNYIAITYMTENSKKHKLVFANTGGMGEVTLAADTSESDGKWTTAYAQLTGENKTNIMERLNKKGGNMVLKWEGVSGKDDVLYIREIVFFKDEADVKAYAAAVPACYNGDEYIAPKVEEKPEVNSGAGGTISAEAYNPFDVIDASNYDIWLYESAETLKNNVDSFANLNPTPTVSGGSVATVETNFVEDPTYGVKCINVVYEPIRKEFGYYRFTTYNQGKDRLSVDLNYIAITYMTPEKGEYQMKFFNSGGNGSVVFTNDTSVSKGKWTTAYVNVTGENKTNIMNRLNNGGGNMRLTWSSTTEGEELYVREIVFFKNEADVKTYAEVAPAYYNGEDLVVEVPKSEEHERKLMLMAGVIAAMRGARWNFEEEKKTTNPLEWIKYLVHWNWRTEEDAKEMLKWKGFETKSSAVSYVEHNNDKALKLEYSNDANYNESLGYYRLIFVSAADSAFINDKDYYVAVTYSSNKEAKFTFSAPSSGVELSAGTSDAERWVAEYTKIEANSGLLGRLVAATQPLTLKWDYDQPDGELYISEIVFFESEELAQEYCEYAENYYNNLPDTEVPPSNPLDKIKGEVVFDFSSDASITSVVKYIEYGSKAEDTIGEASCIKISADNSKYFQWQTDDSIQKSFTGDTYYMAMTYATLGKSGIRAATSNGAGAALFIENAGTSSLVWQTSIAKNSDGDIVPLDDETLLALKTRKGGNGNTTWFRFTPTDVNDTSPIYVREVVFFTSLADAEKYAANAPKYYMYLSGFNTPDAPFENIDSANYDIWLYESAATLKNNVDSFANMNYTMVDIDEDRTKETAVAEWIFTADPTYGVKCIAPVYEPLASSYGYYRFLTYNQGANRLSIDDLNYIAITYMTPESGVYKLTFNNSATGKTVELSADTSVSKGRWTTAYVPVVGDIKTDFMSRLNKGGGNMMLKWSADQESDNLYVREIVFFKNEKDVKTYAEKAPAYYNSFSGDPTPTSAFEHVSDYKILDLSNGSALGGSDLNATSSHFTYTQKEGVDCAKVQLGAQTYYVIWTQNRNLTNQKYDAAYKYAVLTYLTTSNAKRQLTYENTGKPWDGITFTKDTSVNAGKWVAAIARTDDGMPASLTDVSLSERLSTKTSNVALYWKDANGLIEDENQELYVREIVFFNNLQAAEQYVHDATEYYNSLS